MRYIVTVASAAIPAAVWTTWPSAPKPLVPVVVVTEGVREQRQDVETFRARWRDLPPAMVIHEQVTIPAQEAPGSQCCPAAWLERETSSPAHRRENGQRAIAPHARLDTCQRHHMHKVFYGRRWRCRR